jgi:hypothetical protein
MSLSKIDWRQSFMEAVPALRIVEHLDVVEDVLTCFVCGPVDFPAAQRRHGTAGFGLLQDGDDLAVGKAGRLNVELSILERLKTCYLL